MADVRFEKFRNDFGPKEQLGKEWPFLVTTEGDDGTVSGWLFPNPDAGDIYAAPQYRRGLRRGDGAGQLVGQAQPGQQPQQQQPGQLPGFVSAGEPPRAVHLPPTEPGGRQQTVYPPGPENPPAMGYGPGRLPDLGYQPGQAPGWVTGTQQANPAQNAGAQQTPDERDTELQRLRAENAQLRAQQPGYPPQMTAFNPGGGPTSEPAPLNPNAPPTHFNG